MNAMMRQSRLLWVMLGIAGLMRTASAEPGDTPGSLQGAQAVIAILAEASGEAGTRGAHPATDPRQQLAADLAGFTSNSAALKPDQAADAWLALVDRFWTLPPGGDGEESMPFAMARFGYSRSAQAPLSLNQVFAAIPGPDSWPLLRDRTAARKIDDATRLRELGLRVFALLLNRDWNGAVSGLDEAIKALPKDDNGSGRYQREQFLRVRRSVDRLAKGEKAAGTAAEFERILDALKDVPAEEVRIVIPDLAAMTGSNDAARLIEKAVRIPNAQIEVRAGPATRQLVKAAVLGNLDKLTRPQWGLVRGRDAVEYYEAMAKRFPPSKDAEESTEASFDRDSFVTVRRDTFRGGDMYGRKYAIRGYVLGLLAANRRDDAIRLAMDEGTDLRGLGERYNGGSDLDLPPLQIFLFAQALLERKPDAALWDTLITSGLAAGRDEEVLKAIAGPHPPLSNPERQAARDRAIANGYLALDRVDEGIALLRRTMADGQPQSGPLSSRTPRARFRHEGATRMITLGCLLDRPDLIDEGVAAALNAIRAASGPDDMAMAYTDWTQLLDPLTKAGRYRQAESLALEALRLAVHPSTTRRFGPYQDGPSAALLAALARIYGTAGRHADVIALLEKAPWWGANDLVRVRSVDCSPGSGHLMTVAAFALLAEGRTNEARRIAETHLMQQPGDDDGYQVLVATGAPGLIAWLDTLYARDRFEERPLIWKAACQLRAGQPQAAEQTIREALKVDPTDGETRAGDRVRAYSVLADTLQALGKTNDAALFRNVVAAVRLAEKGDEMTEAGLLRRSLPLYDRAAVLFSDAYCVQWRLAERLYATGHPQEAEKHYAIVFERMPEQFGQVASLCFGCEGVFSRSESRSVAERILTRMVDDKTVRPQVFFLLGQLREAQGRYQEAYTAFRRAVNIDPGYLDAWRQISEIAEEVALPQSDRDHLYLRILRLDPLGAHASVSFEHIADPKGLWEVVAANQAFAWSPPQVLLPLPASKAALEQKRAAALSAGVSLSDLDMVESRDAYDEMSRQVRRPGEAVISCSIIAETLQAFASAADLRNH